MSFEQFMNIYVIIMAVTGLIISMSRYIERPHRAWFYIMIMLLGNLLSNYYWAGYTYLMNDYPVVSSFLAYLGWNISLIPLILMCLLFRSEKEKHFFHPLCLIPIPLNIAQFILYLPFGGVVNNIWQGVCCTTIACLSLNSLIYYVKNKKEGAPRPYIPTAMFVFVCLEYIMWTSTCFDWPGTWQHPYTYASFLCFSLNLGFLWFIDRQIRESGMESAPAQLSGFMSMMKPVYTITILGFCCGGYLLAMWIKKVLDAGQLTGDSSATYSIIAIMLFVISLVIVFFTLVIILAISSSQKTAESENLREAKSIAEHSNAAKSDFLANMSHEIRTPINAVLGMNEMILRESIKARDLLPRDREVIRAVFSDICSYSGNIESAGNNLLAIINDILDFSKIEAGRLKLVEGNYKLSSVLNDVSNMVTFKARDKGLIFRIDVDEFLPDGLYGDEVRVRQILTNLLNNAVKYTVEGSISLSIRSENKNPVKAGDEICLAATVEDTGIGIKEEDYSKLFNKFERVDLLKNSTVEGTGLGLAITNNLLHMMNGSIEVKSVYGEGSAFTVRIPQRVVSAEYVGSFKDKYRKSIEETGIYKESFRAPDGRILIVDDTRMNLIVAEGLLKNTHIQIDSVTSGAESVRLAKTIHYDIILMDQRMPVMDGTEAMRLIRDQEDGANQKTPFICLTADAVTGARDRYLSEGFDDYLTKPIDSKALENMLKKYLPAEKVLPAPKTEYKKEVEDVRSKECFAIFENTGIDPITGLFYSQNDQDFYRTVLSEYLHASQTRIPELKEYFEAKDWENYGIQVHALKSTSKMIGALDLSVMASVLEEAAGEGDEEKISASHTDMLECYRTVTDSIRTCLSEGDAPDKEPESMEEDEILEFLPDEE